MPKKNENPAPETKPADAFDVAAMSAELNAAKETIRLLERRQKIDALLAQSDTIDLHAARLLTEAAVQEMDEPDLKLAIDDLRRHKPYLFRQREPGPAAMPARSTRPVPQRAADLAAQRAIQTGNRLDLMKYLRARRQS